MKKIKQSDILFVSDLHIPYEDKSAVKALMNDLKHNKYNTVVLGGDMVDMMAPSRFEKEPDQEGTLQSELDMFYSFMDNVRKYHKGKVVYLIGNHETRIEKYLKRNHELHGLRSLELSNLLMADKYKMEVCFEWNFKGMLFTHGQYANKYPSAKHLDVNGVSGISGHVHRHSVYSKTDKSGNKIWITAPCMQDINEQDFYHGDNWQVGYVRLKFSDKLDSYEVVLL